MAIKAVLFDMDGVLIDSESYYCQGTIEWMKRLGYTGPIKDIYSMLGTTLEVTYQILQVLLDNRYTLEEIAEVNEKYFEDNPLPYKDILIVGVKDILEYLIETGIKAAVCSSTALDLIEHCLQECGIRDYFDFIVSGEQFERSKPDPEIYLHARDIFGLTSEECIVIEDATFGIQAGRNAGMKVIAYHNPKFMQDQSQATYQCDSMKKILEIIKIEISGK